jgi:LemA protein
MSKIAIVVGSILGVLLILTMWVIGNYNSLVTANNAVDKSWSKVETQYQKRLDLIDNLVETTKGGQKQELAVFGKIAEARSRVLAAQGTESKVSAINDLETNIALIPRLQEAYPDLKSFQQVQALFTSLSSTEADILATRNAYNDVVTNFNNNIMVFPKSLFAKTFGFEKRNLFKSDAGAEKAVKVKF